MAQSQPSRRPPPPRELTPRSTVRVSRGPAALALLALGWMFVGIAFVGIFVPLLPTTVFLLLALWAFARSSPRLHDWLIGHPMFGHHLVRWQRDRAVPRGAKVAAATAIVVSIVVMWLLVPVTPAVATALTLLLAAVAVYVVTRPG